MAKEVEMGLIYHASPVEGINVLEPRISNHGIPRIYFSRKRENVLVYLCNAVEKYCRDTGFSYDGVWQKWGPYGFNKNGILRIEEYYPSALQDTYKGVSAYIYAAEEKDFMEDLHGIRDAVIAGTDVPVASCEFIPDAYEAIMTAYEEGKLDLLRYPDLSPAQIEWNRRDILKEYQNAADHPEYRHFLRGKFPFVLDGSRQEAEVTKK